MQWKRGPQKDETRIFEMDPKDGISHINQTFTKYSNIYKDSKKYLKKIVKIISIIFSSVNLS